MREPTEPLSIARPLLLVPCNVENCALISQSRVRRLVAYGAIIVAVILYDRKFATSAVVSVLRGSGNGGEALYVRNLLIGTLLTQSSTH